MQKGAAVWLFDRRPGGRRARARAPFPKNYRLLRTDEYSSVFAFRRTLRSGHFLLHYRPRAAEEPQGARLGLVVAKRYLRRAVDRNLVRRLAREQFRLMRSQFRSADLVVRLAGRPEPLDRRMLASELRAVFGKFAARQG